MRINSFAKIFDDSTRAADLSGPNARNFSLVNRSTIPAARGSSGPTTVRSTRFSFANLTSAVKSLTEIATFSAISPVPAFPGAQKIWSACGDCRSFHVSACSRPPLPMTRILIASKRTRSCSHGSVGRPMLSRISAQSPPALARCGERAAWWLQFRAILRAVIPSAESARPTSPCAE